MADKIFNLLEKHKMAFVGVTSLVLMVFLMGVNSCTAAQKTESGPEASVEQEQGTDDAAPDETGTAQDTPDQMGADGVANGSSTESSKLTDAQKEVINRYTDTEKKLLKRLEGTMWVGADGKGRLEFKGNHIIEKVPASSGSEKAAAESRSGIAISSISSSSPLLPQDGSATETDAVVLLSDGSYQILRIIEESPQADGGASSMHGSIVADFLSREYTNVYAASELKVDGLDDKNLKQALDGNAKEMQKSLREWCEVNHPTATAAVWDEAITYDYASGTVLLQFALTDPFAGETGDADTAQNVVLVTYHTDTEEFEEVDAQ